MSDEKTEKAEKTGSFERNEESATLSWAKKLMTVGVGTFFLGEEALKTLVSEFKLPKEIVSSLLDGAKGVRKEFMQNIIAEMMNKVSEKVDPGVILAEFLKKNDVTFEIKVKVKEKAEKSGPPEETLV